MLRTGPPPHALLPLLPKPRVLSKASAFLPSPRPISKRKNHLRPKILTPDQRPLPRHPPAPNLVVVHEEEEEQLVFINESPRETVGTDPFPPPDELLPPGSVFGIVLRFAALLAVQTVVAVLFLGGWGVEEKGSDGDGGLEKREGDTIEEVEFEKKVLEIRMMARDAREEERKELDGGNGGESEGGMSELRRRNLMVAVDEKTSRKRSNGSSGSPKGRIGVLRSNAKKIQSVPKGFNGMKRNGKSKGHTQADIMEDVSKLEKRSSQQKSQASKVRQISSTESRSINGSSMRNSQVKEFESKPVANKYNQNDDKTNQWWLKLPYVLAIFLHRGTDHDSPKGLYSLKKSLLDDGDSPSHTIVFQDQGDATNFCYLLESFFEDLPYFSADIVPLTIQELEEVVKMDGLDPIVVRKGQLQLYAGQPLAEVETALRSLLD
ncbi:hypothetical protein J5N97_018237 [Dioscorea zingiberensis]|uniref:Uncharacterized protein n=1 Tax=Dioscorea zingiberensis TaxID=325984 RepID=A0A9D5CPU7_9LILI|nr:hypothetical protein J5N97_018237 [Dioscorea zingiberensis]